MGYHPRIETNEHADFITSRTRDSRLWFVNNELLEHRILGLTAKYASRRTITLYGFALEGKHLHIVAHNNEKNRAHFLRDLKSTIARAVPRYTPAFSGGTVWGRRYSNEFLGDPVDIENYFFYTVLQPVMDGLVEKLSDYPGYNCFHSERQPLRRVSARHVSSLRWTDCLSHTSGTGSRQNHPLQPRLPAAFAQLRFRPLFVGKNGSKSGLPRLVMS